MMPAHHGNRSGEAGEDAEDDRVGKAEQPAHESDHESKREAVDRHRAQEAAHTESHLSKDVDDQVVMGFGEQVDGERLEAVAAHQPEEADDEHEHEVDDDAEDRAADCQQDVSRRVDERAHLLGDVDVEVKLLLDPGEPLEKVLLVRGKVGGKRRSLTDNRLHEQQHHDCDEREHGDVDDQDANRPWNAAAVQVVDQWPYPLGEHDRDEHDEDDADDRREEGDQCDNAEHDERRGHERAHADDVDALATRCLLRLGGDAVGSNPDARFSRLWRRTFVWFSPDDALCQPGQPTSLRLRLRHRLCVLCPT